MKKIVIIGLSLILGVGIMAVAVMAQGPGFGRGFGMGSGFASPENFFASLSPEQSAKIQALQQAHLQAIRRFLGYRKPWIDERPELFVRSWPVVY